MRKRMTEEETFEQEVQEYQQAILEALASMNRYGFWDDEEPEVFARFQALAQRDLSHFYHVCARLLMDQQPDIRRGTLKLIGSSRRRDHVLSTVLVQIVIKQPGLREEALSALWSVRTRQ